MNWNVIRDFKCPSETTRLTKQIASSTEILRWYLLQRYFWLSITQIKKAMHAALASIISNLLNACAINCLCTLCSHEAPFFSAAKQLLLRRQSVTDVIAGYRCLLGVGLQRMETIISALLGESLRFQNIKKTLGKKRILGSSRSWLCFSPFLYKRMSHLLTRHTFTHLMRSILQKNGSKFVHPGLGYDIGESRDTHNNARAPAPRSRILSRRPHHSPSHRKRIG